MEKETKFSLFHILVLIILGTMAFSLATSAQEKDGLLKIYFFDIGQGDSIFIETPNGNQILVDGGPDYTVVSKLSEVMPFFDKEIDAIVLSHPHADHMVGLVEVLKRYRVKNIITTSAIYNSGEYKSWLEGIQKEGANIIDSQAGQYADLGNGVRLQTIFPVIPAYGSETSHPHEYMVAQKLIYGDFEILLTGDLEEKGERAMIANGIDLEVDVLKVGHHGSKTSTSEELLHLSTPQLAVMSLGARNRYGHPHESVIDRLETFGIQYYRTDTDGDIKIVTDGKNYGVIKY
jgi:competence protein ComEC